MKCYRRSKSLSMPSLIKLPAVDATVIIVVRARHAKDEAAQYPLARVDSQCWHSASIFHCHQHTRRPCQLRTLNYTAFRDEESGKRAFTTMRLDSREPFAVVPGRLLNDRRLCIFCISCFTNAAPLSLFHFVQFHSFSSGRNES